MFMNSAGSLKGVVTALLLAAVAGGGSLVVGCDIPTAAPILEQRWALTAAQTALGVEELLPDGQISLSAESGSSGGSRLAPASSAAEGSPAISCEAAGVAGEVVSGEGSITVSAEPICVAWTLAELCPDCRAGEPLARIDTVKEQAWMLPPEVVSVRVSGGTVVLSLDHDLDLTPVRAEELEIVVESTGAGAAPQPALLRWELVLEPGTAVSHTRDFSGSPVTVLGGLRLRFSIATPADASGEPLDEADLTRVIRARAHVQSLTIDSARVRVDDRIDGEQEFDLGDQDELDELIERFQQGTVTVTLINQFPVQVSGSITLGDTTSPIDIPPAGTTEVEFSYTREELQELLSGPVTYAWNGSVTSDGEQTIDADMQLIIKVRIDITLRTEAEE